MPTTLTQPPPNEQAPDGQAPPARDDGLAVPLTAEHRARVERAAAVLHQSVTEFAASAVLRKADAVLDPEDEPVRYLSERDWKLLHDLLESDRGPNDALKAAAERYKRWERGDG